MLRTNLATRPFYNVQAVRVVLGLLAQHDEGMVLRQARQLHRRRGPEVVHLVHELRACEPGQAAGHPDVHRVRAGRDHHVGPERRHLPAGIAPHLPQERGDVAHAAEAIARVGRRRPPAVRVTQQKRNV